jgi:hypothetical protein
MLLSSIAALVSWCVYLSNVKRKRMKGAWRTQLSFVHHLLAIIMVATFGIQGSGAGLAVAAAVMVSVDVWWDEEEPVDVRPLSDSSLIRLPSLTPAAIFNRRGTTKQTMITGIMGWFPEINKTRFLIYLATFRCIHPAPSAASHNNQYHSLLRQSRQRYLGLGFWCASACGGVALQLLCPHVHIVLSPIYFARARTCMSIDRL